MEDSLATTTAQLYRHQFEIEGGFLGCITFLEKIKVEKHTIADSP
jgi:hypothetical protein